MHAITARLAKYISKCGRTRVSKRFASDCVYEFDTLMFYSSLSKTKHVR